MVSISSCIVSTHSKTHFIISFISDEGGGFVVVIVVF